MKSCSWEIGRAWGRRQDEWRYGRPEDKGCGAAPGRQDGRRADRRALGRTRRFGRLRLGDRRFSGGVRIRRGTVLHRPVGPVVAGPGDGGFGAPSPGHVRRSRIPWRPGSVAAGRGPRPACRAARDPDRLSRAARSLRRGRHGPGVARGVRPRLRRGRRGRFGGRDGQTSLQAPRARAWHARRGLGGSHSVALGELPPVGPRRDRGFLRAPRR